MDVTQEAPVGNEGVLKTLGQIGYEAYGDKAEWKAYNGQPMPTWAEVRDDIKEKWEAAAVVIRNAVNIDGTHVGPVNMPVWKKQEA